MPTDLVLPAFILTLVANAVLVALALRALVQGRAERERDDEAGGWRRPGQPAEPAGGGATASRRGPAVLKGELPPLDDPWWAGPEIDQPPRGGGGASTADPAATSPAAEPASSGGAGAARNEPRRRVKGAPTDSPSGPTRPRPRPAKPKGPPGLGLDAPRPRRKDDEAHGDGERPRTENRRGSRRRFSLPPLDDDHERVSRSIETFLSGGDAAESTESEAAAVAIATTVAVVAIEGTDDASTDADRTAIANVVATVERTLRAAARSADRVTVSAPGRFRVVLPGTGELAARVYLRRVRATVEPSLEAADLLLGLVTATATVLDNTIPAAVAQAEARLDASLASNALRAAGEEPRVAGD